MAKFLSDLLDAKEPLFSEGIRQLESLSGQRGLDLELVGDILCVAHKGTCQLGLDHQDTTGPELYHALLAKYEQDDNHFLKTIGGKPQSSVGEIFELVKQAIEKADILDDCWLIKKSAAKRLLKSMPPTTVMAHLGYRSVDSMLKHESLSEIYGALRFVENVSWLRQFNKLYSALKSSDFERRNVEVIILSPERWGKFAKKFASKKCHNVAHVKELGIIYILPAEDCYKPGISTRLTALILYYLNEIRLYSSYFKLCQVRKDFGEVLANTLINNNGCGVGLGNQQIHWRAVKRHFSSTSTRSYPRSFEPHVQPEDLHWYCLEEVIVKIDPTLSFWLNKSYSGLPFEDGAVSFNLLDIAADYCNKNSYSRRTTRYLCDSLWSEIFVRYLKQGAIEAQVLQKIDNHMLGSDQL